MKGNLLKRLFKAISLGDLKEIHSMARVIIDHEFELGHTKLSKDLEKILISSKGVEKNNYLSDNRKYGTLSQLPKSKRKNTPLVIHKDQYKLEHDMVLPESVERKFARIEKEFAAKEKLALYGLLPKKKILLYGPPGCGKTLGAQRLAFNLGLPFYKVRLEAVLSSYLGESSINLSEVFDLANKTSCVLFIDEFDSIASTRTNKNDIGEMKRVVNSFLQYLDEYNGKGLLVTATNLTNLLDEAVWRRFDESIHIPLPGKREIERIIKLALGSFNYIIFDWEEVIQIAEGLSASKIVQGCKNGAKKTILEGVNEITQEFIIESLLEVRRDLDER
jgi:SpoVK/Ycf46/Vps4 family AAA+-type ATPase